jgi:hypothetical protein
MALHGVIDRMGMKEVAYGQQVRFLKKPSIITAVWGLELGERTMRAAGAQILEAL